MRPPGKKRTQPDSASSKPTSRSIARKPRPSDRTNAEGSYYQKQMATKTAVVVVLNDGEELEGSIEWYDKNAIKLTRVDEPNLLIRKLNIRYIVEEKERKRSRRRTQANGSR